MKKIKENINKYSTGKSVLLLFVLTNLVYASMLIITIPKTMAFSGGMKLLDMMPAGYNSAYILSLLKALGDNGRKVYLYYQIPVDMIYPFLFAISYCLLMAYFLKKINRFNSPLFHVCFLPVIAGIADYFENFGIISMLIKFPGVSQISMTATNIFTVTKSIATTIYFVILIAVFFVIVIKVLQERITKANTT